MLSAGRTEVEKEVKRGGDSTISGSDGDRACGELLSMYSHLVHSEVDLSVSLRMQRG